MDKALNTYNSTALKGRRTMRTCLAALAVVWLGYSALLVYSHHAQSSGYQTTRLRQLADRNELLVAAQAALLDSMLSDVDRTLRLMRDVIQARTAAQDPSPILENIADHHPEVTDFLLLDVQGNVTAWTRNGIRPNAADRDYFLVHQNAIADRAYVSVPAMARIENPEPFIAVSRAVSGPDGEWAGVLAAALHLKSLANALDTLNRDGILMAVAHANGELLFTAPYDAAPPGQLLSVIGPFTSPDSVVSTGPLVPSDTERHVARRSLNPWNVSVLVGEDLAPIRADIDAFTHQLRVLHGSLWAGGTLLLAAIGWLMVIHTRFNERLREGQSALNAIYARNQAIIKALPDLLVTISSDGRILDYESGAEHHVLMAPEQFLGHHVTEALPRHLARKTLRMVRQTLVSGQVHTVEHTLKLNDQRHYFQARVSRLNDEAALLVILDISQQKAAEHALQWQATHDSLTQLPNRALFYDRIQQAVKQHERAGSTFALLYLDLDGFKAVNDTLGHHSGDALLRQVADRLRATMRASDTVARLAGDEFAFIARHASRKDVQHLSEKIAQALSAEFNLGDNTIMLSASVGVAVCPEDGVTPDALVKKADQAMYRVKRSSPEGSQPSLL